MPLFDYVCADCGEVSELLMTRTDDVASCNACGSAEVHKLLSAHSSASGSRRGALPCGEGSPHCGTSPMEAGCPGPGSCCGHMP